MVSATRVSREIYSNFQKTEFWPCLGAAVEQKNIKMMKMSLTKTCLIMNPFLLSEHAYLISPPLHPN